MKKLIYNYRHGAFFLLFIFVYGGYFLLQMFRTPIHIISVPLDSLIPFCEWFIIPYVFWYAYISLPLVYLFLTSRDDFIRVIIYLFSGIAISLAIFWIFPNGIDFRPTTFPRDNILIDIVKIIYQNDKPTNVCPSLHCYESVVIHIGLIKSKALIGHTKLKIASLIIVILICLSTVFIKQHSIVDVVCGIALALPMYFFTYHLCFRRKHIRQSA